MWLVTNKEDISYLRLWCQHCVLPKHIVEHSGHGYCYCEIINIMSEHFWHSMVIRYDFPSAWANISASEVTFNWFDLRHSDHLSLAFVCFSLHIFILIKNNFTLKLPYQVMFLSNTSSSSNFFDLWKPFKWKEILKTKNPTSIFYH